MLRDGRLRLRLRSVVPATGGFTIVAWNAPPNGDEAIAAASVREPFAKERRVCAPIEGMRGQSHFQKKAMKSWAALPPLGTRIRKAYQSTPINWWPLEGVTRTLGTDALLLTRQLPRIENVWARPQLELMRLFRVACPLTSTGIWCCLAAIEM